MLELFSQFPSPRPGCIAWWVAWPENMVVINGVELVDQPSWADPRCMQPRVARLAERKEIVESLVAGDVGSPPRPASTPYLARRTIGMRLVVKRPPRYEADDARQRGHRLASRVLRNSNTGAPCVAAEQRLSGCWRQFWLDAAMITCAPHTSQITWKVPGVTLHAPGSAWWLAATIAVRLSRSITRHVEA